MAGRKAVQRGSTKLVTLPLAAGSGTAGGKAVRAQLAPTAEERFTMVGVTWGNTGTPVHAEVEIRTRTGGAWTDWRPVGEEEAGGTRQATSAVYVGESDGVQVRLTTEPGAPAPLAPAVILVAPVKQAADAQVAGQAVPPGQQRGRAFTPQGPGRLSAVLTRPDALRPAIVMRSAWGAAPAPDCVGPDQTINAVVVHHTEGTNTYAAADSAGIVRGIQAYHMDGRGWCDIGYNFLVDRFGVIFEGRVGGINVPVHGAHAYEWNTTTAGVSLMGSYMTSLPPEAQLQAAVSLVAWKLSSYYRSPVGTLTIGGITADVISGHRQASSTDCPGQMFYDYLPTFRQRVATAMGTTQSTIQQRWLALGGGTGWVGQPYAGETEITGGRVTQFAGADIYANTVSTYAVSGEIRARYRALLGPDWYMGFPAGEVTCGLVAGGCAQEFAGGSIYWSPASGAWDVTGDIRARYLTIGGPTSGLGFPSGGVTCFQLGAGCSQPYQNGIVEWTPAGGAWEVWGAVAATYAAQGRETGVLGYPTAAATCTQPGGGCFQQFTGGFVVAPPSAPSGYYSTGAIGTYYRANGLASGRLGYPVSDISCKAAGCRQSFENGTLASDSAGTVTFAVTSDADIFINAIAGMAQQSQASHKVPASVTIAQAILESGWGRSYLPLYAQSYFGIKCKTTVSPYQQGCMDKSSLEYFDPSNPVAVVSAFRSYASAANSFTDHGYFLATNSRYAAAFTTTNADDFIRAVAAAGYATDPTYPDTIISIMQRYNLYRFDTGATPSLTPVAGTIGTAYTRSGGVSGPLGPRVTAESDGPVTGSRYVSFNTGIIASSLSFGAHPISGAIWASYRTEAQARTDLGLVTTDPYALNGVVVQDFAGGRYYTVDGSAIPVSGVIWTRYRSVGGESSYLGYPTAAPTCGLTGGGCSQSFQGGAIWWSLATGAWDTSGDIHARYTAIGGPASWEGYPTGAVACGLIASGCTQSFQGGAMWWTPATKAWDTSGDIHARYVAMGGPAGTDGYPNGPVVCLLVGGGCSQSFTFGAMWWTAATNAWATTGAIHARYVAIGGPGSWEGYPTGPISCGLAQGGCSQTYQGGALWWSPATGAWDTSGDIHARYVAIGAQNSWEGYPTGAVRCGLAQGGCTQPYQGGAMWWTAATKAWDTSGDIHARYTAIGGPSSWEGYPTGRVVCGLAGGGCSQSFQGGAMWWTAATRAWDTSGDIHARYVAIGAQSSPLSYPRGPVVCGGGGCTQSFVGGTMRWSPANGAYY